jgi:hypothetical protein
MAKRTARILGSIVLLLAVVGLLAGERQLFNLINIDAAMDALRIPVAALLLYVGYARVNPDTLRSALLFVGLLYIGIGFLGWGSPTLFGLMPSGLTGFDIVLHLFAGFIAIWAAVRSNGPTYRAPPV